MRSTIHLGRVAGIQLGAHWSVLLVAALIAWTLGAAILPEVEPGHDVLAYWLVGVGAAVLFFASLLAHELGHSLIARRQGVEVREITLWLLGGVSKLGADSGSAIDELRMAAIGPAISLVLAAAFGVVAVVVDLAGISTLVAAGLYWLAGTNLLLGLFNLIPAFPLDGGRILRAFLWRRHGDRVRATMSAARAGQAFGYALIAIGIAQFLFVGAGGLWLVLLGWFVTQAAQAEAAMVTQRELLSGVTVRDVMTPDPVVAPAEISAQDLIDRFVLGSRHSAYPVVDAQGDVVGLVTLDEVRRVPVESRATTPVAQIAVRPPAAVVVQPDDAVTNALARMVSQGARRALVLDGGRVVGIVSMTDVGNTIERRQIAYEGRRDALSPP